MLRASLEFFRALSSGESTERRREVRLASARALSTTRSAFTGLDFPLTLRERERKRAEKESNPLTDFARRGKGKESTFLWYGACVCKRRVCIYMGSKEGKGISAMEIAAIDVNSRRCGICMRNVARDRGNLFRW